MQVCPYCPFGKGTFRDKNFLTWRFISVGASPAEEQGRGYPFTALPALYLSHGDFRCFCIFLQKQRVFIFFDGVWFLLSRTFASTFRHRGIEWQHRRLGKSDGSGAVMQGSPCLFGETESQFLLYRQRKLWKLHEKPEEKGSGFPQYRDGSLLFWGIYFHVFGGRDGDLKKRRAATCGSFSATWCRSQAIPKNTFISAWPEKVCNSEKMKHKKDKRNTTGKVYLYLACFFIMKKIK